MLNKTNITKSSLVLVILFLSCLLQVRAQDASQLGISSLQLSANALVENGRFEEAIPLLEELVSRLDASTDSTVELDLPIFILGVAHIQLYLSTGEKDALNLALRWFERLENEYPESMKLKDAMLRKVDVMLILNRMEEAIALIQELIYGDHSFELSRDELVEQLVRLTRIFYSESSFNEGLPTFKKLIEVARRPEDRAWGAAACFEAYTKLEQYDDLMNILPALAYESEVRYMYRLNVAMLQTSDELVKKNRFVDAAILLNLIKTNDVIMNYHETSIKEKQAKITLDASLGRDTEETRKLQQEIANHEATLEQLRDLPTLRTELLLRRARNYNQTFRDYESFWMFYDLMKENPEDRQLELFMYATFTGALNLQKYGIAVEVGKKYRAQFPEGTYYSPVTLRLVNTLRDQLISTEYVQISKDFVDKHPNNKSKDDITGDVSANLLSVWARYKIENGELETVVNQMDQWMQMHSNPVFKDGLLYWKGFAQLQLSDYEGAVTNFETLLDLYPESSYAEDSLMRTGVAYFYANNFESSKRTFYRYTETYPDSDTVDQAFYFLGELEKITYDYKIALRHFKKADELTSSQAIHDGCAFSIGEIYETQKRYAEMVAHFTTYLERFRESDRVTDAIYELGRGYEFLSQPSEMLKLYRSYIERYASERENAGVDSLIEGFAEKYNTNKKLLTKTAEFVDRLEEDIAFRTQIVTDRGFLFEYFFNNKDVDSYLYNRLREHPEFNEQLIKDLSPIDDLISIYPEQLANYPRETPVEFFRKQLNEFQRKNDRIGSARMLMGLYRSDVVVDPKQPYDEAFLDQITPRLMLYIADYSRNQNIDFAIQGWNRILEKYPNNDVSILAYMRLSEINAQRGNFEKAIDYLEQATSEFPGTSKLPEIILRQGELYTLNNETEKAREKYKYILSVPSWRGIFHAQALFQIGESYMAEREYGTAHGYFERTFVAYFHFGEWAARAYLADAEALIALDQKEDAIATLQEALEVLNNNTPEALLQSIRDKLNRLNT